MQRQFVFTRKLTGKEVYQDYSITNLGLISGFCVFVKRETKAIKSIVFKDGNKKIEEIKK